MARTHQSNWVEPGGVGSFVFALLVLNYPIHVFFLTFEFSLWQSLVIGIPTAIIAAVLVVPGYFIVLLGGFFIAILAVLYVAFWFIDTVTTVVP